MRGGDVLDDVEAFLARFVAYPSEAARIAHTLWIAHTRLMDEWESTPRIAFLSPEPGSGKTRALEVTEPLVPRPVHAVNVTPAFLFRKVSDPDGAPTILYDEVDTIFGPRAKDNEDVRGMLNAGHRRGATAGRCVVKGKAIETEELPAYCAVALAGLNDLPDTIMSRSVVIKMRRRAPGETVEPWRNRINRPQAEPLAAALTTWAAAARPRLQWPTMPPGIEDRNADVWEPLLAVADVAGAAWPERARAAAIALVTDAQTSAPTIGVLLLRDLRAVFADRERLPTEAILDALHQIEESPWANLRGKPVEARWLSSQLRKYGVKPAVMRVGSGTVRGYAAADLADPWGRYVPAEAVTGAGPAVTGAPDAVTPDVADVSLVTHLGGGREAGSYACTDAIGKLGDRRTVTEDDSLPRLPPRKSETSETSETDTSGMRCVPMDGTRCGSLLATPAERAAGECANHEDKLRASERGRLRAVP